MFEVIIKEWINLLDDKPGCRKSQDSTCGPGSVVVQNTLINKFINCADPTCWAYLSPHCLKWLLLIQASQTASKAENKGQCGNNSLYMHNSCQIQKIPKVLIIVLLMSH